MTNEPWLVSNRARKTSGAVSVSDDGSESLFVCAIGLAPAATTAAMVTPRRTVHLRTTRELARFRVDTHPFSFLDKQRHADFEAGVSSGHLGHRAACRIA